MVHEIVNTAPQQWRLRIRSRVIDDSETVIPGFSAAFDKVTVSFLPPIRDELQVEVCAAYCCSRIIFS